MGGQAGHGGPTTQVLADQLTLSQTDEVDCATHITMYLPIQLQVASYVTEQSFNELHFDAKQIKLF